MRKKSVSLNEFKNWIHDQKELKDFFNVTLEKEQEESLIGKSCKTKVSEKKLLSIIETGENKESIVVDFIENGGVISLIEEKNATVEVESGVFVIPRFCLKINKN